MILLSCTPCFVHDDFSQTGREVISQAHGRLPWSGVETGVLSSNPLKRTLGLPFNEHGTTKWTSAPILGPEGRVRNDTADALEAKKRVGKTHKSDPIDAGGLSLLLRCGTLPEVWIPPAPLRDQREMLRTRMALRDLRTALKHRAIQFLPDAPRCPICKMTGYD